jgi:hypothetical protein
MLPHSPIRRLQLFELHDQNWFPRIFRSALTEWLRVLWEYTEAAVVVAPIIERAIRGSPATRIVDLCTGHAGPILPVQRLLDARGIQIPVLITDKFPDREAMSLMERESGGRIVPCYESVDAMSVPGRLTGFRTFFNSFHHFAPAAAHRILADARQNQQPIGIFEVTERSMRKVLFSFPASFLSVYLLIFAMRPRRPVWWICTWVLPIIPFTVAWDGFVSHLRSYTPSEILTMIRDLSDETYRWDMGRIPAPRGGIEISYVIGTPVSGTDRREQNVLP